MSSILNDYDACSLLLVAGFAFVFTQGLERTFPDLKRTMRTFAVVGFVGVVGYGFYSMRPSANGDLFGLVVLAFIGSQVAAALSVLIVPPIGTARRTLYRWQNEKRIETQRREEQLRIAREKVERDREWERGRPERERAERERVASLRAEDAAQRRRNSARSDCLLYYHLHAPEIRGRFARAKYDEFVTKYLSDGLPPEEVERQAARLVGLMEGHLEKAGAKTKPFDVAGLARWYEEQRGTIEAQSIPVESKQTALAMLYDRYNDLLSKHLEDLRP